MLVLMDCVARAVAQKGVRGLAEMVPGGPYLVDVAGDAYRRYRERKRAEDLRAELAQLAAASADEARRAAEEVARQVLGEASADDRLALELYLTQIPGCLRQSLKRPDDPSGASLPFGLTIDTADDLVKLLPPQMPRFRPGADLPGRPGWALAELVGTGGFGEVWLARHTFLPQPRAVKFCTDPAARAKLASHEGRVVARVMAHGPHPNVVPLLDAHLDGDAPWLMYEYVGGGCLTDLVHRWQALPPADRERAAAAALHELAAAVGTFHRLAPPVVHRDLKPSNILLASGGREPPVSPPGTGGSRPPLALRITDFGIGGLAVDQLRTAASAPAGWLGTSLRGSYTPLYASPQQRAGAAPDPRDDVHALGVIGYQMVTGHLTQAPGIDAADDLREAGAGDGFIGLVVKCVAQKPDRRPRDAAELAERLAELIGAGRPAAPPLPSPLAGEGGASRAAGPPGEGSKTPTPHPAPVPTGPRPPSPARGEGKKTADPPSQPSPPPRPPSPPAAPPKPSKYTVAVPGQWFARPAGDGSAAWGAPVKLPGEVTTKPGEVYRLAVDPAKASDAGLAKLAALSGLASLEAIDLTGCEPITDAGLGHLAALPGLKAVGLAGTGVTDSGVARLLTRFPGLEAVGLANAGKVSPAVLSYLARLRHLKAVSLPPRADSVDTRRELARRRPGVAVV